MELVFLRLTFVGRDFSGGVAADTPKSPGLKASKTDSSEEKGLTGRLV